MELGNRPNIFCVIDVFNPTEPKVVGYREFEAIQIAIAWGKIKLGDKLGQMDVIRMELDYRLFLACKVAAYLRSTPDAFATVSRSLSPRPLSSRSTIWSFGRVGTHFIM
jgi:hypothetical protein